MWKIPILLLELGREGGADSDRKLLVALPADQPEDLRSPLRSPQPRPHRDERRNPVAHGNDRPQSLAPRGMRNSSAQTAEHGIGSEIRGQNFRPHRPFAAQFRSSVDAPPDEPGRSAGLRMPGAARPSARRARKCPLLFASSWCSSRCRVTLRVSHERLDAKARVTPFPFRLP